MESEQNPAAGDIDIELNETFIEADGIDGKLFYYNRMPLLQSSFF